ncbi:acetate--CoA ligase family protein [Candidatus Woesearchaeota archaeon]|nr:acetate--CoA ligase family protein [Candidatus Woesearchaeota archaeon]
MGKKRACFSFQDVVSLLRKEGVAFCETAFAADEDSARAAALKLGFPVFLKAVSSQLGAAAVHKMKSGLVIRCGDSVSFASAFSKLSSAHALLARKGIIEKKLAIAVQKEASGVECIVGAKRDALFGPAVIFGSGGIFAEELSDTAIRLCPVSEAEAMEMVKETKAYGRISRLKGGDALLQKLGMFLVKISGLVAKHPEISELDLNPVFASDSLQGVVAVDARAVAGALKNPAKAKAKPGVQGFFSPSSVALVGASRDPESVGQSVLRNLAIGCAHRCEYCRPFLGRIFAVNPFATEILGVKCYPSLAAIPEPVDLAIIALPRQLVLKAVDGCIKKKVKAVLVISAGFGEFDDEGRRLQAKIAERLWKARLPLLGPNCLGIVRPTTNLNASFAPSTPPKGGIAFVSQSGALADSIIDWAIQARYGFSAIVSYGNKAMLDCCDFFEFLAADEETKAVALYVEGVNDGREFFERLKSLAARKPVVILKGGRTSSGEKAVTTHTASLAGNVRVFEAAAKQAGAALVDTVEELFDVAKVLAEQPVCAGNGIVVITNGGGCGVICADYCDELGVNLPPLQKAVLKAFDKAGVMHPAYSKRNPLDIVGDAMPNRYELAISSLLKEPYIHGLIVIQTLQAMTNPVLDAKAVVEAHRQFPGKPVITCFMGGRFSRKGMHYLDNMHIPDFNDIRKAVVAMKALIVRGKLLARQQSNQKSGVADSVKSTPAAVAEKGGAGQKREKRLRRPKEKS